MTTSIRSKILQFSVCLALGLAFVAYSNRGPSDDELRAEISKLDAYSENYERVLKDSSIVGTERMSYLAMIRNYRVASAKLNDELLTRMAKQIASN